MTNNFYLKKKKNGIHFQYLIKTEIDGVKKLLLRYREKSF